MNYADQRETSLATMPPIKIGDPPNAEKKDAIDLTGNIGWNPLQELGDNRKSSTR